MTGAVPHGLSAALRPVVLMFALGREAAPLRAWVRAEPRVLLRVTGGGRARAERAVEEVLRECLPALVITGGFAGALRPELGLGTVLYAMEPGHAFAGCLRRAGAQPARFHGAERMLITAREKAECHAQTGADAVEMESAWIEARCREAGVACATVRAVSDEAGEDLPLDFNRLGTPDRPLSPWKLAGAVLQAPGVIPGLLRLRAQTDLAGRALAGVLQRALQDWLAGSG
ncbi:MAG: hypothetical protein N3J91_14915 [Verrucomicrobiae bacterium]|nr:hypothetical protein [Verrucomicrobiae bacterium]